MASATDRGFCKVDLPANWKKALGEGAIPTNGEERLLVKGVGDGGKKIFAEVHSKKKRSLVLLSAGQRRVITEFSDPRQISGTEFDGRWLVFGMVYSPEHQSSAAVFSWDETKNDAPRMIAGNREGTKSLLFPIVRDGKASWIEGVEGLRSNVHLYDLASDHDEVVHEGNPSVVTTFGDMLLWREGYQGQDPSLPAVATGINAVSWTSGKPEDLPSPLSQARTTPYYLSGSADAVVWVPSGTRSILSWKKGWNEAQEVVSVAETGQVEWPHTGGDLVSWGNGQAMFVGDLRSKSYVQITPLLGSVNIWNRALVVGFLSEPRGADKTSVVSLDALPALPGCEQK